MAIVNMKKLTLAASIESRESILDFIQSMECVHMIDLNHLEEKLEGVRQLDDSESLRRTEVKYNNIKFSYDFLKRYSKEKEGLFSKRDIISLGEFEELDVSIEWEDIYIQSKSIDDEINSIRGQRGRLLSSQENYHNWMGLDVNREELERFRNIAFLIGTVSKKNEEQMIQELEFGFKDVYIEKIHEGSQDLNVLLLFHREDEEKVADALKAFGFIKLNLSFNKTPEEEMNAMAEEISRLDKRLGELDETAASLTKNLPDVEKMYDYMSTRLEREMALSKLWGTGSTFILQGWVPKEMAEELTELLQSRYRDIYIGLEEEGGDEEAPVALKNNALFEPFEIVTSMYALPRRGEIDPTPILTPFFLVFFGMMAADIGYGAVLLLATLFALKFMDLQGGARKLTKLVLYCSIPTMIFGWLYGSFFGGIIAIPPVWVDPVADPMQILIVSIVLGIIHLYVALGVKAYQIIKFGNPLDALWDVGSWYLLISGLILMFIGPMIGASAQIAKYIAIVGAALIVLTQGRSSENLIGKFFGGLYGLYGITGYLGDALSYARLLALGLASGLIGWAFNLLLGLIPMPYRIIAGPLIFLGGHTFNLLIGTLGTYVHTSRLQYLEFFGKFYEGGGKAFEPLKISKKFIKVKSDK